MTESAAGGIYLHQLVAREEAAIKRVIAFSGSQGRNYHLTDMLAAQIIVASDDTPVDVSGMNPAGSIIVRIVGQDSTELYDLLMTRPLLVTKVMRTLDEANALMQVESDNNDPVAAAESTESTVAQSEAVPSVSEAEVVEQAQATEPETGQAQPEDTIQAQAGLSEETLPVTKADDSEEPAVKAESAPADPDVEDGQYRALVVDDSAAIRKQLELELRDAGISADFAESGEEALEKLAVNSYNLIFLDIIMPGIDGYETCRQMRLRSELKKTPIIMLSAKTSPLDEVQGVIAGASTYLTKPVKSEQLQSTLKRVSMWLGNFQENKETA